MFKNCKVKRYFIGFLIMVIMLVSCLFHNTEKNIYVSSKAKSAKAAICLYKGQSYKLKLNNYSFRVSNKKIVSVNKNGKIKARKIGKTKITAVSKNGKKKYVNTIKVGKYISSIEIENGSAIVLKEGTKSTLKTKITPSGVLYKDVVFVSDNENIATVDKNGVITAVSKGTAVITLSSKAVSKKNRHLLTSINVIVINGLQSPSVDENTNIIDDLADFTTVVSVNTTPAVAKPTATPEISTNTSETVSTSSPTITPEVSQSPLTTAAAATTQQPPYVDQTEAPSTIQEYIATLHPDPENPVVGRFLLSSANNSYRTIYFINKSYNGKVFVKVKDYSYSSSGDALSMLNRIQNETGSITNSSETVRATKNAKKGKWTIEFLTTGEKYYIQGSVNDNAYHTEYGLIVAEGDTTDTIKIIAE